MDVSKPGLAHVRSTSHVGSARYILARWWSAYDGTTNWDEPIVTTEDVSAATVDVYAGSAGYVDGRNLDVALTCSAVANHLYLTTGSHQC